MFSFPSFLVKLTEGVSLPLLSLRLRYWTDSSVPSILSERMFGGVEEHCCYPIKYELVTVFTCSRSLEKKISHLLLVTVVVSKPTIYIFPPLQICEIFRYVRPFGECRATRFTLEKYEGKKKNLKKKRRYLMLIITNSRASSAFIIQLNFGSCI